MHGDGYAYGAWGLVITILIVVVFFVSKYIPLRTKMEKRSGGALIAFLVALFAEMYGFPLTIYFLGHVFGIHVGLDHVSGHLLGDLISWLGIGNGWLIVMLLSNGLLILGIWLVSAGWQLVYEAGDKLVTHGVYRHMRHPQYTGIFVITLAFMIQWPTVPTLILWPFVIVMYVRLARREERDVMGEHAVAYAEYMARTPMFFPRLFGRRGPSAGSGPRHVTP